MTFLNVNHIPYFYISIGMVLFFLAVWILSIELRLKKFFRGKKAKDLENVMEEINIELKKLNTSREKTEKYLETIERRLKQSIQQVGILRFNPFGNSGSNQSFSIAFLDEQGNGVVLSSLYSREKVNIYAKPINKYQSEYALSKEEKGAIEKAKNNG
ncbi:MAG TPA: DUF4446 family protein [bacterium]|nr:DUF4446 family protein [bacterium]